MNRALDILKAAGFEKETPGSLIEKWEYFVQECKEGYQWDYSEYKHELRVRTLIQLILDDSKVEQDLYHRIALIDDEFKTLIQNDVTINEGEHWWEQSVLKNAGKEYCDYMLDAHKIKVSNIE